MKIKRIILTTIFGAFLTFNSSQAITYVPIDNSDPVNLPDTRTRSEVIRAFFSPYANNDDAYRIIFYVIAIILISLIIFYIIKNKKKL